MAVNPFKPTAGKMPPILIGREDVLADFQEGLDNGACAPGRLMLITGQRGYGKTVLLTEIGRMAQAQGWDVIADTASAGMCDRMIEVLDSGNLSMEAEITPSISIGNAARAQLGSVRSSRSWISRCRDSLVQAHVIDTPARGRLSFAIPQFAEYLADRCARLR